MEYAVAAVLTRTSHISAVTEVSLVEPVLSEADNLHCLDCGRSSNTTQSEPVLSSLGSARRLSTEAIAARVPSTVAAKCTRCGSTLTAADSDSSGLQVLTPLKRYRYMYVYVYKSFVTSPLRYRDGSPVKSEPMKDT